MIELLGVVILLQGVQILITLLPRKTRSTSVTQQSVDLGSTAICNVCGRHVSRFRYNSDGPVCENCN